MRSWTAALAGLFVAFVCIVPVRPAPAHALTRAQAALAYPIYTDGLQEGWENYSWGATVDLAATAPGASQHVIALTITEPYGALHLHHDTPINLVPYASLVFDIEATAPDQVFTAVFYDQDDQQIGKPKPLAIYGGLPTPGAWKTYLIPIGPNGLGAAGRQIRSIVIQSDSGHTEPTVYFRQIGFVTAAAPLPPSNAGPAATVAASGTKAAQRRADHDAANRLLIGLTVAVIAITLLVALLDVRPEPRPTEIEESFVPFSSERYRRPPAFR